MKKLTLLVSAFTILVAGIASASSLKKGDRVMFEARPNVVLHSPILYVYDDNTALVCEKLSQKGDFFEGDCRTHQVHVENLIHPVSELAGYKLGDKVCLNKDVQSFSEGNCGSVVRIYENGKAEILTFSLMGLRKHMNTFDVLVDLNDIRHKN